MYPMKMIPAFKDYLWGGTRLKTEYRKDTNLDIVAESWEVSCHPDGPSTVANGEFGGTQLREVLAQHPGWIGSGYTGSGDFPLLVKLIDAKQNLSVQVHPGDEFARRVEGQYGKNEMWYVVDADPGAELILGLRQPLNPEELAASIADNTLLDFVNKVPVKPGDCYCIPAGMLHAIGGGVLVAEIQQSSNVTYRVYDYGRLDAQGNPRQLHIDKAIQVTDTGLKAQNASLNPVTRDSGGSVQTLAGWRFFNSFLRDVENTVEMVCDKETFHCVLFLNDDINLRFEKETISFQRGEAAYIPAGMGGYSLSGRGKVLVTSLGVRL